MWFKLVFLLNCPTVLTKSWRSEGNGREFRWSGQFFFFYIISSKLKEVDAWTNTIHWYIPFTVLHLCRVELVSLFSLCCCFQSKVSHIWREKKMPATLQDTQLNEPTWTYLWISLNVSLSFNHVRLPLHFSHALSGRGSGALDSLWSRGYVRKEWRGESIGVTECRSSAYISSSLCPGQRVQWLRAVFSIPSPPTQPNPPSLPASRLYFSPPLWNFIPQHVASNQEGTLCVCLATSITYRKHLQNRQKKKWSIRKMWLLFVPVQPESSAERCRTDLVCALTVNTEHFVLPFSWWPTLKSVFVQRTV